MTEVFADAAYFIALLLPRDALRLAAIRVSQAIANSRLVTSEPVLTEVLNYVSNRGSNTRRQAAAMWRDLHSHPSAIVIPGTARLLERASHLYEQMADKSWSLTDCASILIMRERSISEVLTSDHHFEQAGFKILLGE